MDTTKKKKRPLFDLTEAERKSLRDLLRYALAIFTAVGVTLVIVALAASALGGG